ncbi:MAG TPA: hypothetical protein VHZ29_04550 [Rhizomicrobium sp.]|nr:hypothetical protein [Rhizomicrobium sp.]
MLAVIVAALTSVHGAEARPASHRLALPSGFSIEVPDGFASCDAATNKLLGNAPHLIVLAQMCASLEMKKDGVILVDMTARCRSRYRRCSCRSFPSPQNFSRTRRPT